MRFLIATGALIAILATSAFADAEEEPTSRRNDIYNKPYLTGAGGGVAVGGYMDMEFRAPENGISTFDQYRFIPFITGYVSDRVTVSAEIEFEHGGFVKGDEGSDTDGEIKLEYAVLDYRLTQAVNFRGGVILAPLGAFNVLHDSPLNDLTARPVVTRQLIPSTLSESGMGFFGGLAAGEEGELDYDVYVVNGFDEGIISGDPGQEKLRIRDGRGSKKADNNNDKAIMGRLGYSPRLGSEVGVSVHNGAYDDAGEYRLTIAAVDAKFTYGPFELKGEYAGASAQINRTLYPEVAESQRGAYALVAWHVLHDKLLGGSVVTLVARGDWMDFDTDRDGDSEDGLTLGANFRPTEETAFKVDYNWRRVTPAAGERQDATGTFFFSFASYF